MCRLYQSCVLRADTGCISPVFFRQVQTISPVFFRQVQTISPVFSRQAQTISPVFSRQVQTISVLCSPGRHRLSVLCSPGRHRLSVLCSPGRPRLSVLGSPGRYRLYQSCVLLAGTDYISPVFSRKVQTVESCVLIEVHHDCVVVWITHLRLLNTSLQRCVMTVSWSGSPTSGH